MNADTLHTVSASLEPLEYPFYYLGLNTVPKRFIAGTLGTGALLYAIKPSMLYDNSGVPYPWKLTSKDEEAVMIPWWFYAVGVGAMMATFI
jgi:hypothetical protein